MPTLNEIQKAHSRIKPFIHNTPVLTNSSLDDLSQAELYFKCENFQKAGSFKIRGATNAVLQLSEEDLYKGVATASSGNHGAALSMAVTALGGKTKVVMPNNTPDIKIRNVKRNGGQIIWCEPNQISRDKALRKVLEDTGSILVHPYNDKDIICGQGTASLELMEECPDLDILITPVSGGGLLGGTLCYAKEKNKNIQVFGAEPMEADDAYRSLLSGEIQSNETTNTICDGLRAQIGTITFPIIRDKVNGIIPISEEDIISTMQMIWERMKIIVEPSCSIALAAVLNNKNIFSDKKVGLILSGGNVDLDHLPWFD